MMPAMTKEGGMAFAFPDTCMTPIPAPPGGAPIPYPNMGMFNQLDKGTKKVKFRKKPVAIETSKCPRSSGDEAGVATTPSPKGLMSQKNMGKVVMKTYSSKVKAEGKGIVRLLDNTGHNGGGADNMPMGTIIVPGQVKIFVS